MKMEVRKITTNTVAQLIGKVFSAGTSVITIAIVARRFGDEGSGAFYLMTGFAGYFYLLTDFGVNAMAARELSAENENQQKLGRYFGNLLAFRFLESLLLVAVLALAVLIIPFRLNHLSAVRLGILIGLGTIVAQAIYNSCTVIFQSTLSYSKSVLASIVGNLFFIFLVFAFLFFNQGINSLVTANTLGAFLVSLISLLMVAQMVGHFSLKIDWPFMVQLIKKSLPLGLGIVLTVIVAKADQFLLSVLPLSSNLKMSNDYALGNYGSAYKIFENLLVFPTYFVNAIYPLLVRNYAGDGNKFKKLFWGGSAFLLGFSLWVTIGGWFLAPWVIAIIGGGHFALAPMALRVLLLSLPLFFLSAFLLFVMITQGQQSKVPYIYLAAAVFNVVLNLIFIPVYGFMASAVITGLTELLILILVGYFALRALLQSNSRTSREKALEVLSVN